MMNELAKESSPYLLQHANNPIHWKAWNTTTLATAKQQNKLIVVSVGYAACHWCHVMEHESFENDEVAKLMNEHFVSIKVDREERPDIDQVYMDAAYILTGQGGWPLNVICLPDGKPVYAGTYFKRSQWLTVLRKLASIWQTDASVLSNQAEQIMKQAEKFELVFHEEQKEQSINIDFEEHIGNWLTTLDWKHGGAKGAPKFPMPTNWELLLQYGAISQNNRAIEFANFTIQQICNGGIYDHIGGGFARYSVDAEWHVPHFEKMLYDNAQLIQLLANAYKVSQDEDIKFVAEETIAFLTRELRAKHGAFYSSYDADSEGVEGKFYVFDAEEVDQALQADASWVKAYFDIQQDGNWEETNVLRKVLSKQAICKQKGWTTDEFNETLQKVKNKLFAYRAKRVKPNLDDKQLTSWNCLTILGFVEAYKAFGDETYKTIAEQTLNFLLENCWTGNVLYRNYKNGTASIHGFLDDYSFFIEALIGVYEISFRAELLQIAQQVLQLVERNFLDVKTNLYFYTSRNDEALISRKKEITDNVIPASNSSLLKGKLKLGKLLGDLAMVDEVEAVITNMQSMIRGNPKFYSNWLQVALMLQSGIKEIAIVGEYADEYRKELQQYYLPNCVLLGSKTASELPLLQGKYVANKTLIYVCENQSCRQPVETIAEAIAQLGLS